MDTQANAKFHLNNNIPGKEGRDRERKEGGRKGWREAEEEQFSVINGATLEYNFTLGNYVKKANVSVVIYNYTLFHHT